MPSPRQDGLARIGGLLSVRDGFQSCARSCCWRGLFQPLRTRAWRRGFTVQTPTKAHECVLEPRVHEHGVATPEMGADRQHASTGYRSFQTARSSGDSFVNSVRANKNSAIIVDTHTRRRGEKSARNDTESHSRARATLIPESCVSSCYLPFLGPFFCCLGSATRRR